MMHATHAPLFLSSSSGKFLGTEITRQLRAKDFAGLIFIRSLLYCDDDSTSIHWQPSRLILHLSSTKRSANDSVEDVKAYRDAGANGGLSKDAKAIEAARDILTKSNTALSMLTSRPPSPWI